MHVRHQIGPLGVAAAAGVLVSVAALPAGAVTTSSVPGETTACTAARAAQDAYRVGTLVPLAEETNARVVEVQALLAEGTDALPAVEAADADAAEALTEAEGAVTTAQADLEAARAGGDPVDIEAAEDSLAVAVQARNEAAQEREAAAATLLAAEQDVLSLEIELLETRLLADYLTGVSLGRDFETEAQLDEHVRELRDVDLGEYADLVQDLGDTCFVYLTDDQDEDAVPGEVVVVAPSAPAATAVTARATFTG